MTLRDICPKTISLIFVFTVALTVFSHDAVAQTPADWSDDEFTSVSRPPSPAVAYAIRRGGASLDVAIRAASLTANAGDVSVELGVAAARKLVLKSADARITRQDGQTRFVFSIPAASLVDSAADYEKLRLAFSVRWSSGVPGVDRQRERFLHSDSGAAHKGLSSSATDWQSVDLTENEAAVADRRNHIAIDFEQPLDGKATLVIEDGKGRRVRNLVSGLPMTAGRSKVSWDGLDDNGLPVAPGAYRWRAISHPGIRPDYLFSFCNDGVPPWRTGSGEDMWGADHSTFMSAASGKDWTFLGAPVAESGYAIVAIDQQGVKRMQYIPPSGTGIHAVALASEGDVLYAVHDGFGWGQKIDRTKPDWKGRQSLSLTRFDIKSGKVIEFADRQRFCVLSTVEVGPGSPAKDSETMSLAGLAVLDGKLYLANRRAGAVWILSTESGAKIGEIPLPDVGPLTAGPKGVFAISGASIVRIDPATTKIQTVASLGAIQPAGLAMDAAGSFYVSDSRTNTVQMFDSAGKALRQLGKPGGAYTGAWDSQRMVNPKGLAIAANGWLWVTEERVTPKRLVAWDPATGQVRKEKYGPTAYGASGGGFDYADPTHWIGQGTLWQVDFAGKSAKPLSILGAPEATHFRFFRSDGRTFIVGFGKATYLLELMPDGTTRSLALLSSAHQYAYSTRWDPPPSFVDAFKKAYPNSKDSPQRPSHGMGMLWVDRNGDAAMQTDEIEFSTVAESFGGSGWGHDFADLTLRVPASVNGRRVLVALKPDGFSPGGAPKYPPLNAACLAGTAIDLDKTNIETTVDHFGNLVCNSDPQMKSFAPDGRMLWSYPNRWSNVHGSHDAPLPEPGVMQGSLFFLGTAPLDDRSDVFVINGNHGRFFLMTSDGLYLDEMFKDVRMGLTTDANLIGGECFGGMFGRSQTDGNYYLQSGHTDYRLFKILGLDQVRRSGGSLTISAGQVAAAERALQHKAARVQLVRDALIPFASSPPAMDGKLRGWPDKPTLAWDKSGRFPVSVRAARDAKNLYLAYDVVDDSPWINNGKDWQQLFKTGDSVNLELGADPAAKPTRAGPVPGDLRILIAPYQGKNVAVLYRHRVPGAKSPVTFTCPWRSETVDQVNIIDAARITVSVQKDRYHLEAAIPLTAIGFQAAAGPTYQADFGVIYGDPSGAINMLRSYWSNQNTGLVNDVPGEIMLTPRLWGAIRFEQGE